MTETGRKTRRRLVLAIAVAVVLAGLGWWLFPHDSQTRRAGDRAATVADIGQSDALSGTGGRSGATSPPIEKSMATARRQTSSSNPLPPPGTPLAQSYEELKARADAGDASAASRLFQEARHCFHARMNALRMPRVARAALGEDTSKLDAEQLKRREEGLADLERSMQQAREDAARCDGLSDAQLQLAPLTLQAARLGDAEASACYVNGIFLYAGGLLDHPEWLEQYKSNALALAQAAVEHGNWQVVAQLRAAYGGELTFIPLGQLVSVDPVKNYRYLKLQRLGAQGGLATQFDAELVAAAREMSTEQLAEADAWAQDAYVRYFNGQPTAADQTGLNYCHE